MICVTSGAKGGTGKTTFSFVLAWTLYYIFKEEISIINLSKISYNIKTNISIYNIIKKNKINILDFPAFTLYDKTLLTIFKLCKNIIFVVDEDPHTLESTRIYADIAKGRVAGLILNMVIGKPSLTYLLSYRKLGNIYIVHFDEKLRIYRGERVDPVLVRSRAVAEMARAAVDLAKNRLDL